VKHIELYEYLFILPFSIHYRGGITAFKTSYDPGFCYEKIFFFNGTIDLTFLIFLILFILLI